MYCGCITLTLILVKEKKSYCLIYAENNLNQINKMQHRLHVIKWSAESYILFYAYLYTHV